MEKRTCFVVSRIGEEGGDIRRLADDVFDLLIQPALEKFNIVAIRADHIAGTGSITNDVIRHVQESDLCIIDLSGKNPNVYYECGRRHETGKPFIQIISKEEEIPFDIADIRTIKYELADPREVRSSALKIQSFVEEILGQGFATTKSATTMSSLLEALNRIERRLVSLESGSGSSSSRVSPSGDFSTLTDNPLKAFQDAFLKGDIATIINLLPRLERLMPPGNFIMAAGILAIQGEPSGGAAVLRTLQNAFDRLDSGEIKAGTTSLVQYHVARSTEAEGAIDIEPIVQRALGSGKLSNEDIAYLSNQLGIMYHGADKYEDALRLTEDAIKHNPTEGSYHFNISIIYEKLSLIAKAIEHAKKSLELKPEGDSDHLVHAIELFTAHGLNDEAAAALRRLESIDLNRAAFMRKATQRRK